MDNVINIEELAVTEVQAVNAGEKVQGTISEQATAEKPPENKCYTLRRLKPDDILAVATILGKIGFKEFKNVIDVKSITELIKAGKENGDGEKEKNKNEQIIQLGMDMVFNSAGIVFANLESCKTNVYQLLADLSGMSVEQIRDLDAAVFFEMIIDVIKMDGFKDFFKVVLKFIK